MGKTTKQGAPKMRPYWHVDAKWIFSLLLGAVVIVLLWLDIATRLTSREVAIPLATAVIALQFSPEGLDDQAGLEKVKSEWLATGQAEFKPIEGMPLKLSREQVETLPARELRLTLFRQMAEPLYDDGVEGFAASISDDPLKQEEFKNDAQLLGIVSKQTHSNLIGIRWLALATVIILAVPAVYFSAGLGRLITPGIVFILASWVGALVFGLSRLSMASSQLAKPAEEEGMMGMVWQEIGVYLPGILMGWIVAFGLGLGLLLIATGWSLVRRFRRKT